MKYKIAIVGLGYVGLPLALEFSKKYPVIGFDINYNRVEELNKGNDSTKEVPTDVLKYALNKKPYSSGLYLTNNFETARACNVYVVTVPTPVDENKTPDLSLLRQASETVGNVLSKEDIVIYESTVYPGATEEECVPILEEASGLKFNVDFYCGYSPERINPGDGEHTIEKIMKITSGSTKESAIKINNLYNSIISAGTYQAPSIRVAEAAKVIENAQRDINIAFVNELAKIFSKLEIDTHSVLEAASTKWNFLNFKPGLVGGHCIGVDPYYLAQKATGIGYRPEIILAGRRLNDSMGDFVALEVIKLMSQKGISLNNSKVLILGFTFKENCSDIRNTGVINVYNALNSFNLEIDVYDPMASHKEVERMYNIRLIANLDRVYDVIIHAVAHNKFNILNLQKLRNTNSIVYDIKGTLPFKEITKRL
ncbi:MAG: nucleotide sugar dehydrogenase [Jejuia sp.]